MVHDDDDDNGLGQEVRGECFPVMIGVSSLEK